MRPFIIEIGALLLAILVVRWVARKFPIERCDHDGCMLTRLAEKQAELEKE